MTAANNVVPIKPTPAPRQSEKKWGAAVMSHGQCILPALLLRAQARLLVNSTQMIVLLQLVEHWWTAEGEVFPSVKTIAERINMSTKQVQRTVDVLAEKGLITKINRRLPGRGKASNQYKFDGLVKRLKEIEADFDAARKTRRAAGKPGGLVANNS